jgi:hypothetical protein
MRREDLLEQMLGKRKAREVLRSQSSIGLDAEALEHVDDHPVPDIA